VHSLTGEYLNSADATERIIACKLFPLLKSQPNKVNNLQKKREIFFKFVIQ